MRWLLALVLVGGCIAEQNLPPRVLSPTLLVENNSTEILKIWDGLLFLGTIFSGETRCLHLWGEGTRRLKFWQTRSWVIGPDMYVRPGEGWEVTIDHVLRNDVYTLIPADRCGA